MEKMSRPTRRVEEGWGPVKPMHLFRGRQKGIALLTVLWVLTILMVIVFSFSLMTRTETLSTYSFKEGTENRFLAEAGIERGIMELLYRKQNVNNKVFLEGMEVWKIDGRPNTVQLQDGTFVVKMTDESGKININSAPEMVLRRLIGNLGVEGEALDTIVDSIMDWKDKDDLVRIHGAESDYYQSLPDPYKAKNADFDTLEELQWVKGVTRDLLFGSGKQKGLIDYLTVQGNSGSINVNAASKEVLMAVSPGIDSDIADQIITYRESQEIKSMAEVEGLIGQKLIQLMPLNASPSDIYTLESFGYKKKPQVGYAVRAIVSLLGLNKFKYLYYKTPVTLRNVEALSNTTKP
jgi:general secretion pathway protein K